MSRKFFMGGLFFLHVVTSASGDKTLDTVPTPIEHRWNRLSYTITNLGNDIKDLAENLDEFRHNFHAYAASFSIVPIIMNVMGTIFSKRVDTIELFHVGLNTLSGVFGFNRQIQTCRRADRIKKFIQDTLKNEQCSNTTSLLKDEIENLHKKIMKKIMEEYGSKIRKQKLIEVLPVLLSSASLILSFTNPDENWRIDFCNKVFITLNTGLFLAGSVKDLMCESCCKKVDIESFSEDLRALLNQYKQTV